MPVRKAFLIFALLLLTCLWSVSLVGAQTAPARIVTTAVDASSFPQITARFRALNAAGRPVSGLTPAGLAVTDNGQPVSVERLEAVDEGLWVHFIIDAGVGMDDTRWAAAQSAVRNFVRDTPWMISGLDQVAITVVTADGPRQLIDFTSNAVEAADALSISNPSTRVADAYSNPLPAVQSAAEQLARLPQARNQAQLVYLFSPGFERSSPQQLNNAIAAAVEGNVAIHTAFLRPVPVINATDAEELERQQNNAAAIDALAGRVRSLAEGGGGTFTWMNVDPLEMSDSFSGVAEQRQQYELSYRTSESVSGTRQVRIASSSDPAVAGDISYNVEVNPPRVAITSPRPDDRITRQAEEFTDDATTVEPTTQTVEATVIFPDNFPRRLLRATLLVDGVEADTVTNPGGAVQLVWDLRELESDVYSLQVEVEDELGLISLSEPINASVELIIADPSSETGAETTEGGSPTGTTTIEPTVTIQPTPIPCYFDDPICENLERPVKENLIASISLLVATASLIFAGVIYLNRDKAPVRRLTDTVRQGIERMTARYRRAEVRAYLEVLAGDPNIDRKLDIYGDTPIGRSRQNAELLFQQDDAGSPISRLHCTITDEEDHFMLRDEDSANGTYLNGQRLKPLEPTLLRHGDEIELARVERGGVRLRFLVAEDQETQMDLAPVAAADDWNDDVWQEAFEKDETELDGDGYVPGSTESRF